MNSPSCSFQNRDDARFCGGCAAPLLREIICASCGRSSPRGPRFCDGRGQSLAESGHLDGMRGAYRLARAVEDIEVPDSVQAMLAARIDRLDKSAKQVLHGAAVIGNTFPQSLLEGVTGLPVRELEAILHRLALGEFVDQEAAHPEVEYVFKHPLTRQAAYNSQLRERRRRVHGEVARLLEERHHETLDEKAALLAPHLEAAGQPLEAARDAAHVALEYTQAFGAGHQ